VSERTYTTQEVAQAAGVCATAVLQYTVHWPKLRPRKVGSVLVWTQSNLDDYIKHRAMRLARKAKYGRRG